MYRTKHAKEIAERFRELVENAGDSLPESHYDELSLLIEAGIDTALVGVLERTATEIDKLAHKLRNDAEFFED